MVYRHEKTGLIIFSLLAFLSISLFFIHLDTRGDQISGTLHVEAGGSSLFIEKYDLTIRGWDKYGVTYFFLPSYAVISSIRQDDPSSTGAIYCTDGSLLCDPVFGEIQEVNVYYNSGDVVPWKVAFFHSENLYTAYIDLKGTDVYSITHDTYIPSELLLYTPGGALEYKENICIKGRGNSTWNAEKQPYEIKLPENYPLCGMKSSSKWALLANFLDDTKILNKMIMDLSEDIGMPYAVDSDWVDLYINGEYRGNYLLCKDPGIGKGRLELSDGCFIEKTTQVELHNDEYFFWVNDDYFRIKDPDPVSEEEFNMIRTLVEETDSEIRSKDPGIQVKHIDVPSFARRAMIDEFSFRLASMEINCYFYNIGNILYAGPCWDYDMACGNPFLDTYYEGYDEPVQDNLSNRALKWDSLLLQNPEYKLYYDELFEEAEPLFLDIIQNRIDQYAQRIHESVLMDHAVWDGAEPPIRFYDDRGNQYRYLKFFLYQRLKLLANECGYNKPLPELSFNNAEYHEVLIDKIDGSTDTMSYRDGDFIDLEKLPEYDDSIYCGWVLEREEGEYAPLMPVYEDLCLTLRTEEEES